MKQLIALGRLKGTIRFYGTPAEERIGGKIYMIREGLFRDADVVLVWHPSDETNVDYEGSQANIQFVVEFRGRTAHAAADPWNGRSATDAIELFTHGVNMLREHVRPSVRMHYMVERAGDVPNVVPDYARILTWVRDSKRVGVDEVFARVQDIARGAALMAGVEHTLSIQTGYSDTNILETGNRLLQDNLLWSGRRRLHGARRRRSRGRCRRRRGRTRWGWSPPRCRSSRSGDPPGGSTDVGDVSWVAPTLHFIGGDRAQGRAVARVARRGSSGTSIGHKGMMVAANTLAATAVDLFEGTPCARPFARSWPRRRRASPTGRSFLTGRRRCRSSEWVEPAAGCSHLAAVAPLNSVHAGHRVPGRTARSRASARARFGGRFSHGGRAEERTPRLSVPRSRGAAGW